MELVFEGQLLTELVVHLDARAALISNYVRLLRGGLLKLDDLCRMSGLRYSRIIGSFAMQRVLPAFRMNCACVLHWLVPGVYKTVNLGRLGERELMV